MYARILQAFFKTVKVGDGGSGVCPVRPRHHGEHRGTWLRWVTVQSRKLTAGIMRKFRQVVLGISKQVRTTRAGSIYVAGARLLGAQTLLLTWHDVTVTD